MVTYLGGSILITIFALGGSIVSYNLHLLLLLYNFASIKLALRDCFIAVICDQTFLAI